MTNNSHSRAAGEAPDNPPAFPCEKSVEFIRVQGQHFAGHDVPDSFKIIRELVGGITIRDYFANDFDVRQYFGETGMSVAMAMATMNSQPPTTPVEAAKYWLAAIAKFKYMYADAMLAERSRP